ncbi:MAG TPA: hypothetical protein VIH07_00900 [Candidatus Humimicrobiaceae bacterium]
MDNISADSEDKNIIEVKNLAPQHLKRKIGRSTEYSRSLQPEK